MAFHFSEILSLLRNHPFALCFVLLFFTPPLFPVVVFFSPLLISTALCVLALVSIGAHFGAASGEESKGGRLESSEASSKEVKKLRVSRDEISWFDWMKGLDGNVRHWAEKRPSEDDLFTRPVNKEVSMEEEEESGSAAVKSISRDNKTAGDDISEGEGKQMAGATSTMEAILPAIKETEREEVGEGGGSGLRFAFVHQESIGRQFAGLMSSSSSSSNNNNNNALDLSATKSANLVDSKSEAAGEEEVEGMAGKD